jgi:hypothetical protein
MYSGGAGAKVRAMLKPTPSPLRRAAIGAAVLASLAAPAVAGASSQTTYSVTFRAEMVDRWKASERFTDDCKLTGAMCVRDVKGDGTAKTQVRTRRPTKVMVVRGVRGRPPMINMGATPGLPITGSALRSGSLVTKYEGPWKAANPDQVASTDGCGNRTVNSYVSFMWQGADQLQPVSTFEHEGESCPEGLNEGWEWQGGESPSLSEALAKAAPTRFGRSRQFTVSGKRTWTGIVPPVNETGRLGTFSKEGSRQVTWSWEATFRMDGGKRRKKRR